jgi:eukaryotic-like serine/threonine-protein kinase
MGGREALARARDEQRSGVVTAVSYETVKEIVADALEVGAAERTAFLRGRCGNDLNLLREVESILAGSGDRLETAAQRLNPRAQDHGSLTGHRLGAYEVVSEVGRGGMGAVYLARRADREFEKQVAIKVLKRGTDTDEVLRRFRAERQILARLEHPNIAHLLDAGTTPDGLPYFALEYVEGHPITDYAREKNLSIRERIELMLPVCRAVHFAHQNLVVHRDLKPRNILVTPAGVPKLLDFGIAKLLSAETDLVQNTMDGAQRFTPAYASPEQVLGEPVTTATDVYSLGALLYELLAGEPPHRFSTATPSATELFHVIAEEEPPRASAAAVHREARRDLRGDIDNILRKALQKEPTQRYSAVTGFADDLRRYLSGMPVRARRDTVHYRAGKFIRRHKLAVASATLTAILLLAAIVATNVQRRRAEAGEEANRRLLYAAQMGLAYGGWEAGTVERVAELLDAQRPQDGRPDLRRFEWSLLWQLIHGRSKVLRAPGCALYGASFAGEGQVVATGSDGNAYFWDINSGDLRTVRNVAGATGSVSVTPDGRFIAAPTKDGAVLSKADSGELVARLEGHSAATTDVDISPDGRLLGVASADGIAKLWDLTTQRELHLLTGHTDALGSITFSPDGQIVATISHDHTVRLWDTESGKPLSVLEGHTWWVLAAAFSPDGKLLATAGSDGAIKLWNVSGQVEVRTIAGVGTTIRALAFSSDGKLLFTSGEDTLISVRDVATGNLMETLRGHAQWSNSLATMPGSGLLASASGDGTVRLWDIRLRPAATLFSGHRDWTWALSYSPDGQVLASASKDGTVKLWNSQSGQELASLEHGSWVNAVAFSADGMVLATGSDDAVVRLWNVATRELISTIRGHRDVVECVAFSPAGNLVASGSKDGEVALWDSATQAELARFPADKSKLAWAIAFSPDGKSLAVAEANRSFFFWDTPAPPSVKVWDLASRRLVARLNGHVGDVRAVAFSPDGKTLASGSDDGSMRLWKTADYNQPPTVVKTHGVIALTFADHGQRLVTAGMDRTMKIWDATSGTELCTLRLPAEPAGLAFAPKGSLLAVAGKDNNVHQWRADPPVEQEVAAD